MDDLLHEFEVDMEHSNDDTTENLRMEMEQNSNEIAHEYFPFLRVYKNGRIERPILSSRVPPGFDPVTGVQSKDVIISSETNLSGRMFIPKMETPRKLPLLIHYHGGGFCTGSAFCPIIKYFMIKFVSTTQLVTLSVDFRLAPEHPLPIAYEDSWEALKWVATHAQGKGSEAWLNEYVDFEQVVIGGESSGAIVAHYVVMHASTIGLDGMKIKGLSLVHPCFGGYEPDKLYQYLCPTSSGTYNDPILYPGVDTRLGSLACDTVMIFIAGKDMFKLRGLDYYQALKRSGYRGKIKLVETENEGHCFHLLDSSGDKLDKFLRQLASFAEED